MLFMTLEELTVLLARRIRIGMGTSDESYITVDAEELASWLLESGHVTQQTMFKEV